MVLKNPFYVLIVMRSQVSSVLWWHTSPLGRCRAPPGCLSRGCLQSTLPPSSWPAAPRQSGERGTLHNHDTLLPKHDARVLQCWLFQGSVSGRAPTTSSPNEPTALRSRQGYGSTHPTLSRTVWSPQSAQLLATLQRLLRGQPSPLYGSDYLPTGAQKYELWHLLPLYLTASGLSHPELTHPTPHRSSPEHWTSTEHPESCL